MSLFEGVKRTARQAKRWNTEGSRDAFVCAGRLIGLPRLLSRGTGLLSVSGLGSNAELLGATLVHEVRFQVFEKRDSYIRPIFRLPSSNPSSRGRFHSTNPDTHAPSPNPPSHPFWVPCSLQNIGRPSNFLV